MLTLPLLTCLVRNSLSIRARPVKRIRITKEVPGIAEDKNRVVAITFLPWISTSFLKKKKKISSKSNASTVGEKVIILPNILRKKI